MVVYGPEGPEYTGMGGSLAQALYDAINESNDTGYELQVHNLYLCPKCNGIAMQYNPCDCGYKPQSYIDKQAEWDKVMAVINARNLHNGPLDQEIFGRVA
jgi:hypothetical protein